MSELYFVPTPNWFISRPLDIYLNSHNECDGNIMVALSVIGSIYFVDHKFKAYYGCVKNAHFKRINSVAFKQTKFESKLFLFIFILAFNLGF